VSIPVLNDADILPLLEMGELIGVMEGFLRAEHAGATVTPPRHRVAFEPHGSLVFTVGGIESSEESLAGFRVYDTFPQSSGSAQLVAVWNSSSGRLLGIVAGDELGAWRTGALGGVAVKYMGREDARTCAVLGTGRQARTQLLAAAAVRDVSDVRVYARDETRRRTFADEMSQALQLEVRPVSSPEAALREAAIVLCATNSPVPILQTSWLAPGAHVNSVGPKVASAHELPLDIAERITLLATDSPRQIESYSEPYFLEGSAVWPKLRNLAGLVIESDRVARENGDVSLFCSVGLAGTEVAVAAHVLSRHARKSNGMS
jgi:ornithine cyclodeaminase